MLTETVICVSSFLLLCEGENGQSHKVPGHRERGGSHADLQHVRAFHRLQVRHQDPENRKRLQSLHVRERGCNSGHIHLIVLFYLRQR